MIPPAHSAVLYGFGIITFDLKFEFIFVKISEHYNKN